MFLSQSSPLDLGFCWKGLFWRMVFCCEIAGGQTCPLGCGRKAEPQTKIVNIGLKKHGIQVYRRRMGEPGKEFC
jgi:hypothetical protein